MTENVIVTIKGYHQMDGTEQEPVVMSARGKYSFRSGHHFVSYEEELEEGGRAKSLIRFDAGSLVMSKKGDLAAQLELAEGKRILTKYQSPAGILEFETLAEEILLKESEDGFELESRYGLYARDAEEPLQMSRVVIRVEKLSVANE